MPVNSTEILTQQNYELSKKIVEERLNKFKQIQYNISGLTESKAVDYYTIKQDNETGKITLELPENDNTNMVLQYAAIKATFNVVDEDGNILMDNSHIEKANVAYSSSDSGITVYLTINFNKEGTQKLKEISNTYIKTTDEDGNDTTKKITIKIDDTEMLSTYFAEEISNGAIQLSFGTASSNSSNLVTYAQEASNLAVLLNTGELPVTYSIDENKYILSNISVELISAIIIAALAMVATMILIIKYKSNGFLAAISCVGYIATLLIVIRLANVVITLEGIIGILLAIILNYMLIAHILHLQKSNSEITFWQGIAKYLHILVPATIITIVFCFVKWLPIYSFGMTMFWGLVTGILYNLVITQTLILKK